MWFPDLLVGNGARPAERCRSAVRYAAMRKLSVHHLLPVLLLVGCNDAGTDNVTTASAIDTDHTRQPPPSDRAAADISNAASDLPSASPHPLDDYPKPAADNPIERDALAVLQGFARTLEQGFYDKAWTMLGEAGQRTWSRTDFDRLFADLRERKVGVLEGRTEGAAGSSYYTAPIIVSGHDRDGRPIRYEGEAVLRRVNDIDGASAAQRRWHFERLTLDWTH